MAWLYVPSQSAAESEGSISALSSPIPAYKPYVMSSGKPIRRPLLWHGWKKRSWIARLYGTISQPFRANRLARLWISSLAESHVSHGQRPGDSGGSPTSATCGQSPAICSSKPEPEPCSSKTSQGSSLTLMDLRELSRTLTAWGGMRNGVCSVAAAWAPSMCESGCSSWLTPRTSMTNGAGKRGEGGDDIQTAVTRWATPIASGGGRTIPPGTTETGTTPDGKKVTVDLKNQVAKWAKPTATRHSAGTTEKAPDGQIGLEYQSTKWPTPTAQTYGTNKGGAAGRTGKERPSLSVLGSSWPTPTARSMAPVAGGRSRNSPCLNTLTEVPCGHSDPASSGGGYTNVSGPRHLNPAFVDWLMGMPVGYSLPTRIAQTDYIPWATQFRRRLREWLGEC